MVSFRMHACRYTLRTMSQKNQVAYRKGFLKQKRAYYIRHRLSDRMGNSWATWLLLQIEYLDCCGCCCCLYGPVRGELLSLARATSTKGGGGGGDGEDVIVRRRNESSVTGKPPPQPLARQGSKAWTAPVLKRLTTKRLGQSSCAAAQSESTATGDDVEVGKIYGAHM